MNNTMIPINFKAALERLIAIGQGDTGQSRRVADFLLAWWNAGECGSFDLTNLWGVDSAIASDMVAVFGLIARVHTYPDTLGYGKQFENIVAEWRPELVSGVGQTTSKVATFMPSPVAKLLDDRQPIEYTFANDISAKLAIADELATPLAKLPPGDMDFIDRVLAETLDRNTVLTRVRSYFRGNKPSDSFR